MPGTIYWKSSQQCLEEEELSKTGLTCYFALDVTYMSLEWTNRGSNPGEIGAGAHGRKQGILLQRRSRRWSGTVSPQTDSVLADAWAIETYLKARGKWSGTSRATCETCRTTRWWLSPRMWQLPHAAVAATNFPVSTSAKPSLLRRGRRHHGGTATEPGFDAVPPTGVTL